jgi:hypothetical protein
LSNPYFHCLFSFLLPIASSSIYFQPVTFLFRKVRIYKTIILLVVLYGCETWSLTVREEHKLRVFENRVLKRIFGPKRGGVT